ncbi:MAG: 30S ribosomal protein S6 [bacterium]|nr:30S ribosomal protein S6 [bacterium]
MSLRQYEGMFLFDSAFATDFSKAEAEIKRILDRAEAEIVFCRKWDERRLAYDIRGRRRGTYVLTYFNSRPEAITGIERDVQLSEGLLRILVLQAEGVTPAHMNEFAPEKHVEAAPSEDRPAAAPAGSPEKPKAETAEAAEQPKVEAADAPEQPKTEAAEATAASPPPVEKDAAVVSATEADDAGKDSDQ